MCNGTLSLVSLGCAKNAVDLQVRAGNLLKEGATLSSDPDRADTVIVNTCAFIEPARQEAEAELCGDRPVLGRLKELIAYWKDSPRWRRRWQIVKLCRNLDELRSAL